MPISDDYRHPRFNVPTAPPFAPGTSPFRGIGSIYKGLLEFIQANVPGGVSRVMSEIRNPDLVRFLGQSFSFSSWYDVVPVPYLGQAIARARGISFDQQLIDSNRWSEERTGAIYRALLSLLNTERVAATLPKTATIIHDFGPVSCKVTGPQRVSGARQGIPAMLVRWLAVSHSTYLEAAMRRAGAASVRVNFGLPTRDGDAFGQELFRLPFEIEWS